jgi:4-diphosphocytidyl-2-C-methyl-D-erythritol kinase
MISEIAPAKLNLYLHVGACRPDRLHDLSSLFVFADVGDVVSADLADGLSLDITGPFAAPLLREPTQTNLVFKAAAALRRLAGVERGARIVLDKRLPIAAGVGGGSADAAAALRALVRLWKIDISADAMRQLAFSLGADVPACLDKTPVLVSGAGEIIERGPRLPPVWVCLVNPLVAMPTGAVFAMFDRANPDPPPPAPLSPAGIFTQGELVTRLAATRNDLQPFAIARQSVIQAVIDRLSSRPGALFVRMSGSGATVFALFSSLSAATRAAQDARGRNWWAESGALAAAPVREGGV